ncbi:hypothetical protein IGI49_000479 [Enterococcus sp. AZ071]
MEYFLKCSLLLVIFLLITRYSNTQISQNKSGQTVQIERQESNNKESSKEDRQIRLKTTETEIIFEINNSIAATESYRQLPLIVELKKFGSNEKNLLPIAQTKYLSYT